MGKATSDDMDNLHGTLARVLAEGILVKDEDGKPNSALMSIARQFLKDNGIETIPGASKPVADLIDALPFPRPDSEVEIHVTH